MGDAGTNDEDNREHPCEVPTPYHGKAGDTAEEVLQAAGM